MAEINYCQNLWAQFAKTETARSICKNAIGSALETPGVEILELAQQRTNLFAQELATLEEQWNKSFVTLEDGRFLFGPEFNLLSDLWNISENLWRMEITNGRISSLRLGGILVDRLSNFDWLANLIALKELELHEARFRDEYQVKEFISACAKCSSLRKLNLSEIHSSLMSHKISTWGDDSEWNEVFLGIADLNGLEELDLSENSISALPSLLQLKNLQQLRLSLSNRFQDLSFIQGLDKLKHLSAGHMDKLTDISALERTRTLESLNLSGEPIDSLDAIKNNIHLRTLFIPGTKVVDFEPLANFVNLEYLDISRTAITDLWVLQNMTNLHDLELEACKGISDFSVLNSLTTIKKLNLSSTDFHNWEDIFNLHELLELDISQCWVGEINDDVLANFPKLSKVKAYGRKISPTNVRKLKSRGITVDESTSY